MIADAYRDYIKSTLLVLKKKILRSAGDFINGDEIRDFIEAVVFLKERGYSIEAEGALERYEDLPEQDREILDELNYPANLKKLISEGKLRAVIKTIVKSGLLQEEGGLEAPASGILFEEVVRCFDTWGMRGTVRQMDNITEVMQELLLQGIRSGNDGEISIYDMAMGKGFLLFDAGDKAGELCPEARVICCGQEKDPHNYIMAKTIARLKGREHEFEAGVKALSAYADVHCVKAEGPHPAGNIGTIVAAISPINKGEYIWSVNAQDVANIGRWVMTGEYQPERVISVGGPAAKAPKHYRVLCGASMQRISAVQMMDINYPTLNAEHQTTGTRIVSGSALSGTTIEADGFLGMYDQQVCFIEEGDKYDFMGWLMPGFKKYSFSYTFLSGLLRPFKALEPLMPIKPTYSFNTNMHGSVRPFLFTGSF